MALDRAAERSDETWRWRLGDAGAGILRVTLLFGSAAAALALFLTPLLDDGVKKMAGSPFGQGIDMMSTGSIGQRTQDYYVVRRSVLQPSPGSVCIIRENGARSGEC